jgi:L-threonylcarbamoyladenylate synthase
VSEPRRLDFRASPPDASELESVVRHLRDGGLVAHPTETVYGFGGLVQRRALERLAELKSREHDKPFLLLVPSARSVARLEWTEEARELARAFWPGSVTLVLSDPGRTFPLGIRSERGAVAVRQSSHPLTRRLLELLDEPLTSTSANVPGGLPASSGEQAFHEAKALGAGMEMWVLDAGALSESSASTIVDCTGPTPRILRAGATPAGRLRCVVPGIESTARESHGAER